MINSIKKIHFINRLYHENVGDWLCSPINWYFDFFKDYNIIRHDISAIDWHEIGADDLVILGGGGLLYASVDWNRDIAKLLDRTKGVIAWGVGHNLQSDMFFHSKSVLARIDYDKMKLIAIRDYEHESGLPWLPCVTCKIPQLGKSSAIKRRFGVIEHPHSPIKITGKMKFDKIDNTFPIDEITDFIASSEVIISNAYHMIYFSQLMEKDVICVNPFSDKFNYYKYKPPVLHGKVTEDRVEAILSASDTKPKGLLDEATELNDAFFNSVKEIVIDEITVPSNSYSLMYNASYGGFGSVRRELLDIRKRTKIPNFLMRLFGLYSLKKQLQKLRNKRNNS